MRDNSETSQYASYINSENQFATSSEIGEVLQLPIEFVYEFVNNSEFIDGKRESNARF